MATQSQTLEDLKQDLARSRARLLQALSGVSEEQFKRRPASQPDAPAEWSIAEVLAYLLASDRLSNQRIGLALKEDGAEITPEESGSSETQARTGRLAPVPQLIHGLLAARRELDLLLEETAAMADGLERCVVHPQLGRQSVAWIVREEVLAREQTRVTQIEKLRLQVGSSSQPGHS